MLISFAGGNLPGICYVTKGYQYDSKKLIKPRKEPQVCSMFDFCLEQPSGVLVTINYKYIVFLTHVSLVYYADGKFYNHSKNEQKKIVLGYSILCD